MKRILIACGLISGLFTLFHVAFWWMMGWPSSLAYMTADHRMLIQATVFCFLPFFALSTWAYMALREELVKTRAGRLLIGMNIVLYLFRALAEVLFGNLARGESLFFFILTLAVAVLFAWPLALAKRKPCVETADHRP